ncbi:MAG: DUF7619 domain-containing protein [Rufibacter sp.]
MHDKTFSDIAVDQSGNIFLTNNFGGNILKLDSEGNIIKSLITSGSSDGYLWLPQALAIAPNGDLYVMDQGTRIQKFNKEGLFLKKVSPVVQYTNNSMAAHMSIDRLGNLYAYNSQNNFINVFDKNDEEVKRIDGVNGPFTIDIAVSKLLISQDTYVEEYISDQSLYKAFITGKIYQDKNSNCSFDSNESFLTDIVLKAEPGPFYGFADDSGNYTIPVEAGSYTVSPLLPQERGRDILATCPVSSPPVILVSTIDSKVVGPDFGLEVTLSPHLNVNLSSNRRRRCFENVTTVSYSNTGFAPAANAKVTVQFPAEVIFKSASMPFTRDSKGNYVFAVGDLQPNQHGIITIKDSVSCADPNIRGLTVCTRAWITPTNTYPTPPTYNRADMAVEASATNEEQARFVLKNKGQGAMTDSLTYRVYQDLELSLTGKYKLAAGDSLVLKFPTESRVLRVEADQPQEHPIKTIASADLEMKKANTTGLPDVAMMAMPKDDPEPEITEECLPIIDSFDPNDKQVVPVGLTSEKYTPTNTLLRYTVRFQNTGTDVAYRVVVVDTLSAELDMSTFAVGAVSHPYKLAVSGKERPVLTFTFDNIMLPDSGTNQAGSNGAIQFSIKPKAGLAEKHLIENFADIFFDYNEPVRTNTTQNRIYDMPPVVSTKPLSAQQVEVSPVITSFSPAQSRLGGIVTLTGKNFTAASAGNKVTFNGVMAQILSASVSELKVTVPNNSYTGKIKVVTPDGASSSATEFVVFQPPTISAVSLAEAVPGTVVTITGNHFSPITTQDTITFGDVAARVLSATTSQLQVEVPTGATLGKIVLKTLGGMVESQQAFKVWYLPTITNFTPAKGKAGTLLTLNGTNFAEVANRNVVKIGTVPLDVLQATQEKLEIRVPATAVTGKLSVQTPGGTAATATDFVFVPAPVITSFNPPSGNAGTTVTITGKNFNADGAADVITFNGKEAPVVRATETELVVKAPKGVTTGALVVTGAGGQATGQDFVVNYLSTDEAISVYPNPTAGEVVVNWFKANYQVQSISVYDAVGKEVIKHIIGNLPNDEVRLSIAHYGKGVYLVRIKTSEGVVMKRITVL